MMQIQSNCSCQRLSIRPQVRRTHTSAVTALHSSPCAGWRRQQSVRQPQRVLRPIRAGDSTASTAEKAEVVTDELGPESSGANGITAALIEAEAAVKEGTFDVNILETLIPEAVAEVEGLLARAETAEAALSGAEEKAKNADDSYLRLRADFENFRKRSAGEKEQLGTRVKGDVIMALVPLIDSFEAAQNSIKPETENEKKIATAYQGLYKQLVETFKGLGVEAVPGVGEPFDPEFHDAIMKEPNDDVPDGTVLQEFRKGFRIGDTLLRPGMVKVSVSEQPAAAAAEEGETIPVEGE